MRTSYALQPKLLNSPKDKVAPALCAQSRETGVINLEGRKPGKRSPIVYCCDSTTKRQPWALKPLCIFTTCFKFRSSHGKNIHDTCVRNYQQIASALILKAIPVKLIASTILRNPPCCQVIFHTSYISSDEMHDFKPAFSIHTATFWNLSTSDPPILIDIKSGS